MAIRDYVEPYNDSDMIYNYEEHRYVLTVDYIKNMVGEDETLNAELDIEERAKIFTDFVSRATYDYIHSNKDPKYYEKTLYYLSHSAMARETIKKVMIDVAYYTTVEGGYENSYLTGINLQENTQLKVELDTAVGVRGKNIIHFSGLGVRILPDFFTVVASTESNRW